MTHYIGATGLDIFNDAIETAIEETTLTLTNLIDAVATQDNLNAIYSSNYTDTVGDLIGVYSSNYSDKVGVWGSNYTDREITYTSNYVRTTSNILVNRIKLLEGSEGTAGDPSADPPIPPIPPTGNIYILATLGLLTAGATATGILIGDLTIKVNNNAIYGSNYSDKVGVWGSNYARDKIGVYSSNYTDLIGIYSSNYARDKIGVYSSNYTDLIGIYSSNYARDKVGVYSSNYTDLIGGYSSNYARDKVGVWGSNYSDKVGVYSSNYTNREITFTSNYVARINTALSGANYWTEESTNNIYLNKSGNVGIGTIATTKLHVYQDTINDTKLIIQNNNVVSGSVPTEISVVGATSTTIGSADRMLVFPYTGSADTKDYDFTTTQNLICDILVVGGGGGGGAGHGGGGGAGQLVLIRQATLIIGNYIIKVGKGGIGAVSVNNVSISQATKGGNSSFNNIVVAEGGGANTNNANDKNGGSGAGGDGYPTDGGTSGFGIKDNNTDTYLSGNVYSRGNNGGNNDGNPNGGVAGGGGGAGTAGNGSVAGNGLSGISEISYDFKTNFGTSVGKTESDTLIWFAGGGGGGYSTSIGGLGGGGNGAFNSGATPVNGGNATNGTGSGGGGGSGYSGDGGAGGTGIVIIRYRLQTSTSSSLELVRGTTTDGSVDYSVGNYDGNFKIKSVVNTATPDDRLVINSAGNVGIGTTSHATYKLDVNGDINISAGSQFKIGGNVLSTFTPTSANTIGIFNSTQFENVSSLIQIKSSWKPTTSGTADTANGLSAGTSISITSITASGLITANAGLTISGAGQSLISEGTITARIINASGLITGNAGLTIPAGQTLTSSGTLTATTIIASELITANAGLTIASAQTLTSGVINASGLITATQTTTGTNDILNMRYNSTNGIRFTQRYIGVNDVRYDLIQKVANVDKTASLTIYNGNVGIGRTDPTNILQIGSGNRLRIANNNADFTIIGTGDTPELHTRIFMGGINYTEPFYGGTGNLYMFSGNGGKHLFITQTTTTETERMRIGNNGNVAIGTTDTATYKLNVAGDINVSGAFRVNNTAIANSWSAGTPSTNIYYNLGNVGIGTTNPSSLLHIKGTNTILTIMGQGGGGAKSQLDLSTYDPTPYVSGCSLIATDDGAFGATFQIKLKASGANTNGQFTPFSIGNTGNVSIPSNLNVGTIITDNISSRGTNGPFYIDPNYSTNNYVLIYDKLDIQGSLYVSNSLGIGANPSYTLDIPNNGTGNSGYYNLRYFNYDTNITASYTYLSNVSARIGGSLWCGSWIASSSDSRIKEDIQDINDDSALQMILAIEPKTYKYIDKVAKGDKKVYGFIAQQIKQVLPDAIGIEPEYIPNIMLLADYDNEIITLPSQPVKVVIKLNDKIRCYDKDNKHIDIIVIEIIDELTFKIKFNDNKPIRATKPTNNSSNIDITDSPMPSQSGSPEGTKYTDNKIFVSGTEVDDFHTISKEYIFTLNVCATQELHRRIISQEQRIKELEGKMTQILNYISI